MSQLLIPNEFLFRQLVETMLSLFLAVWMAGHFRNGRWAHIAAVGAALFAAINVVYLIAYAAPRWLDVHTNLLAWVFNHAALLGWTKITGLALVVLAVTVLRPSQTAASTA
ncbi:MAG TPA: hypothetical protein VLI04_11335 [Nocardioidaceae bacterium]|nr:hypothetical protein [Nocardioidaceae bacterium]